MSRKRPRASQRFMCRLPGFFSDHLFSTIHNCLSWSWPEDHMLLGTAVNLKDMRDTVKCREIRMCNKFQFQHFHFKTYNLQTIQSSRHQTSINCHIISKHTLFWMVLDRRTDQHVILQKKRQGAANHGSSTFCFSFWHYFAHWNRYSCNYQVWGCPSHQKSRS